jgi:hypothetical protein
MIAYGIPCGVLSLSQTRYSAKFILGPELLAGMMAGS